jgi:RecB family endonuclease NucS
MTDAAITAVPPTSFSAAGIRERADMQRLLRAHIDIVAPDTMVIAEEFGSWDASARRIDLLGIDRDANLVVD